MILLAEASPENTEKHAEALQDQRSCTPDEPPPTYCISDTNAANHPYTPPLESSPISAAKTNPSSPANFVSLRRENSSIKGVWTIDISLVVPASLLPPLALGETEETRKNVLLWSRNGSVDADITIAPYASPAARPQGKRVVISARTSSGSITFKVHAQNSINRPSFILTASSSTGSVSVHLPRTFHGPLLLKTTNGQVAYSPGIEAALTTIGKTDGTHRAFIGETAAQEQEEWTGDEVALESRNGSVKIYFDDEVAPFFSRLFGRFFGW